MWSQGDSFNVVQPSGMSFVLFSEQFIESSGMFPAREKK
jgi:hypothetical protein